MRCVPFARLTNSGLPTTRVSGLAVVARRSVGEDARLERRRLGRRNRRASCGVGRAVGDRIRVVAGVGGPRRGARVVGEELHGRTEVVVRARPSPALETKTLHLEDMKEDAPSELASGANRPAAARLSRGACAGGIARRHDRVAGVGVGDVRIVARRAARDERKGGDEEDEEGARSSSMAHAPLRLRRACPRLRVDRAGNRARRLAQAAHFAARAPAWSASSHHRDRSSAELMTVAARRPPRTTARCAATDR